MEIALRQALEKSESNEASHSKQKPRKKKDTESDQDEILARTLVLARRVIHTLYLRKWGTAKTISFFGEVPEKDGLSP